MTNFLITAGFICTLAVTLVQVVLTPWHRSMTGRSIFGLLAILDVIIGLPAARAWFGDYPYRAEIIMVSLTLLIVAALFIGFTIVRAQLRGAREGATQ